MTQHYLEFEKQAMKIAAKITELREKPGKSKSVEKKILNLEEEEKKVLTDIYSNLSPWQRTMVARHPLRPHASDYIYGIFEDFVSIAGDRRFAEDPALMAGFARFNGQPVALLGTEKGKNTKTRVYHNFGMPRPEGYRKAQRLMEMANRFGFPIITFVDTPGAYPGIDAEARGQAEAIASCIQQSMGLEVPVITYVIGEGGSGGALAIATANKVFMLENSIYSVISPEGCASILWRDRKDAEKAANALKLTAQDLDKMGIIDGILTEPNGGAHRDSAFMMQHVAEHLKAILGELATQPLSFSAYRRDRFLQMVPAK